MMSGKEELTRQGVFMFTAWSRRGQGKVGVLGMEHEG